MTFRFVPTAHVLCDHDVPMRDEVICSDRHAVLVIGSAFQDNWEFSIHGGAVPRRAINVSREVDAIAHWNHLVLCDGDLVRRVGLRIKSSKAQGYH